MTPWTVETAALAALLVAGHSLGDFVFQTDWMIRRKADARGLLAHVATVGFCQWVLLLPFAGSGPTVAVGGIVAVHLLIDLGKGWLGRRAPRFSQTWFVLDQFAHLVVLAGAWKFLVADVALRSGVAAGIAAGPAVGATPAAPAGIPLSADLLFDLGVLLTLLAVNVNGVSAWVGLELARWKLLPDGGGDDLPGGDGAGTAAGAGQPGAGLPAGRVIGVLERMFIVILVLLDRWDGLGLLLAAKSLARFRELDHQRRAEYYLVGTLISFLAAIVTTLGAKALLRASFGA